MMTAVFIHTRDVGARALAFLIFEVLIFEGPVSIRRAGGRGSRSHYLAS